MRVDPYALKISRQLEKDDVPFYALIMAAMRRADTPNLLKLQILFPSSHEYLVHAYNCPACSNDMKCEKIRSQQ